MEPTGDTSPTETPDLSESVDRIGSAIFGQEAIQPSTAPESDETPEPSVIAPAPETPAPLDVPKSWKTDMHEFWPKLDRKVQEYYLEREKQMLDGLEQYKMQAQLAKEFQEVATPFQSTLKQIGLTPVQAAKSLFVADHNLRYAPADQKPALLKRLAENYGIDWAGVTGQAPSPPPIDPVVKQVMDKVSQLEHTVIARQQADYDEAKARASKEVEAFAADTKAHPHFETVADDIAAFIKQGLSLQDAYDRAVWANPVTRAKEQAALLTAEEAKLKERARLEALPKKRAAGINVKASDSNRKPEEPLGSLEETIRETNRAIRARVS